MPPWNILVLGCSSKACTVTSTGCTNWRTSIWTYRRCLGSSEQAGAEPFSLRTLVRNVSLLTPELLGAVNQ